MDCSETSDGWEVVKTHSVPGSLCFLEALQAHKDKQISEEEYLAHLLAHFRGVNHPADEGQGGPLVALDPLKDFDPVATSIRTAVRDRHFFPPVAELPDPRHRQGSVMHLDQDRDMIAYQQAFMDCASGSSDKTLAYLRKAKLSSHMVQPIAVLAASKGQAEILDMCFIQGVSLDADLDRAAYTGLNAATLEVLYTANWRNIQDSKKSLSKLVNRRLFADEDALLWLRDHGSSIESDTVADAAICSAPLRAMDVLLRMCDSPQRLGETWALQLAARGGDIDMVKWLLDAGVDANSMPAGIDDPRHPTFTALHEAERQNHKDVAKLLQERGASGEAFLAGQERRRGEFGKLWKTNISVRGKAVARAVQAIEQVVSREANY